MTLELMNELKKANPVDASDVDQHVSDAQWDAMLAEITSSDVPTATPSRVRVRVVRRRWPLAAALASAGLALVLVVGTIERTSTPAFAIRELPNGVIEIENVSDIRDVEGLENELREFGIDAEVVTIPASPSVVGDAFAYVPGEGDPSPLPGLSHGRDGEPDVFTYRIDPAIFKGSVVIQLNVKALPNESYRISQEAFAAGEALGGLQCALGTPVRAGDVAQRLPELGITAQWYVLSDFYSDGSGGGFNSEQVDEVPDGEIVASQPLDRETISFEVVPDGTTAPKWHESATASLPCTEEQADRWRT